MLFLKQLIRPTFWIVYHRLHWNITFNINDFYPQQKKTYISLYKKCIGLSALNYLQYGIKHQNAINFNTT